MKKQTRLILLVVAVGILASALFLLGRQNAAPKSIGKPMAISTNTQVVDEVATSTTPIQTAVSVKPIPDWTPITLSKCGIKTQIPPGWIVESAFSASIFRSPEDILKNEQYAAANGESQGEGGADLIYRSLYIVCYPDLQSYVSKNFGFQDFKDANSLSALFDNQRFHTKGSGLSLMEKVSLGNQVFYEFSSADAALDGKTNFRYSLIGGTGQIIDIELDHTGYDGLSLETKEILASMVLSK